MKKKKVFSCLNSQLYKLITKNQFKALLKLILDYRELGPRNSLTTGKFYLKRNIFPMFWIGSTSGGFTKSHAKRESSWRGCASHARLTKVTQVSNSSHDLFNGQSGRAHVKISAPPVQLRLHWAARNWGVPGVVPQQPLHAAQLIQEPPALLCTFYTVPY